MTVHAACALVMHADCGRHDTGWGHPEHQGRLPAVVRAIEAATPSLLDAIRPVDARPASIEQVEAVHTAQHVQHVRALVAEADRTGTGVVVGGDTVVSVASWDAALASAGCAIDAAGEVARGDADTAFALCRPPGHHASADRVMGFCLFNNVAVAARALQKEYAVGPVLIVDWDVHHGNGTQDVFYEDSSVYYVSLHQSPWYPGTGHATERGRGRGMGTTRNVPLAAATSRSRYMDEFEKSLDAAWREFVPEFVLVSAGFDSLAGDPLGGLLLEPEDMYAMATALRDRALVRSGGRIVALLEGGYAPDRTGQGVVAALHGLAARPC